MTGEPFPAAAAAGDAEYAAGRYAGEPLGAPLARMEAEGALGALLARFSRISLAVPRRNSAGAPSA